MVICGFTFPHVVIICSFIHPVGYILSSCADFCFVYLPLINESLLNVLVQIGCRSLFRNWAELKIRQKVVLNGDPMWLCHRWCKSQVN